MKPRLLLLCVALALPARGDDQALTSPLDRQPVVIKQIRPEYPWSLRMSGNRGSVVVDFIVDPLGNVVRAGVLQSSHPDFEAPAVEAVLQWKFRPGFKNGHPVYTHMAVPIIFELNPRPSDIRESHGAEIWHVPNSPAKGVPPEFAYDVPPKPVLTNAPVYPFALLVAKMRGKATVTFAIDPTGQPRLVKVDSASDPDFGAATQAMIEAWRFMPATKGGQPCWALLRKEEVFERDNDEFPLSDSALRLLRDLKRTPCPILASTSELDAPIHGRFQPSPSVPDALAKSREDANALVEFIVDHAGHAQLPRIVSASDPAFGWAAATAVARWQFTQPLSNGRPVDVFARVPVVFQAKKMAPQGS